MPVTVRPFTRADRDQVTALVNAHVAAVVPNVSVSVQTVLSQLERDPGEFIVDPWVAERKMLVAEQRGRIAAAAHLVRYAGDDRVGESVRGAAEIRWLLWWPDAPFWPDAAQAGESLATAVVAQLRRWKATRWYADGSLPAPGVYGVPEQWPHVLAGYQRLGFAEPARTEVVLLAAVDDLPLAGREPVDGLQVRRSLGLNGTRLTGLLGAEEVGYVEVDTTLDAGSRASRLGGWADVGNLWVAELHRRRGVGTWLLGQAADWLRLGGVTRLLDYAEGGDDAALAFLRRNGFRVLTRTVRGLSRDPG